MYDIADVTASYIGQLYCFWEFIEVHQGVFGLESASNWWKDFNGFSWFVCIFRIFVDNTSRHDPH